MIRRITRRPPIRPQFPAPRSPAEAQIALAGYRQRCDCSCHVAGQLLGEASRSCWTTSRRIDLRCTAAADPHTAADSRRLAGLSAGAAAQRDCVIHARETRAFPRRRPYSSIASMIGPDSQSPRRRACPAGELASGDCQCFGAIAMACTCCHNVDLADAVCNGTLTPSRAERRRAGCRSRRTLAFREMRHAVGALIRGWLTDANLRLTSSRQGGEEFQLRQVNNIRANSRNYFKRKAWFRGCVIACRWCTAANDMLLAVGDLWVVERRDRARPGLTLRVHWRARPALH